MASEVVSEHEIQAMEKWLAEPDPCPILKSKSAAIVVSSGSGGGDGNRGSKKRIIDIPPRSSRQDTLKLLAKTTINLDTRLRLLEGAVEQAFTLLKSDAAIQASKNAGAAYSKDRSTERTTAC